MSHVHAGEQNNKHMRWRKVTGYQDSARLLQSMDLWTTQLETIAMSSHRLHAIYIHHMVPRADIDKLTVCTVPEEGTGRIVA